MQTSNKHEDIMRERIKKPFYRLNTNIEAIKYPLTVI